MDSISKLIGSRIRKIRIKCGLTQFQLAELIDVSAVFLSNMETGKKLPSVEALIHIANALDVSSDDILCDCLEHRKRNTHDEISAMLAACTRDDRVVISEIVRLILGLLDSCER